ncbi:MAG: type II toxin-antitoxin system death-on-curing family toxin [Selenomonadaceae bacterium]|nr:type II toxin-antitoxin system death-on-curing family toxin [Selenomonadaceae bacterium]
MKRPNKKQILKLHSDLIKIFGGIEGIRDENLLDSAIETPFQTFGGQDLYPTLIEKAARLCFGLIKNHPFLDGNKRIGTHAMLVFLEINKVKISYTEEELIEIILGVADNSVPYEKFLNWLEEKIYEN